MVVMVVMVMVVVVVMMIVRGPVVIVLSHLNRRLRTCRVICLQPLDWIGDRGQQISIARG
jgi:hypothetical protein